MVSPDYNGGDWPTTQAELAAHVLIHHPESSWRLWLDPEGSDPSRSGNALYIDDSALAVEAGARGQGIALARARLVAGDLRAGRLVRLLEREVPAEYDYWAVWSGSSPKLPVIATVVDAVAALFNDEKRSSKD